MGIGRTGVLATALAKYINMSNGAVDITDQDSIWKWLMHHTPDVVINAAGIVKDINASPRTFNMVNAVGPWLLRECCDDLNIKLVHVTTDCVYDGRLSYPEHYNEDSPLTPTDAYSLSKAAGEAGHVNVRTSFIGFGEHGLIHWLQGAPHVVKGYSNVWWSGLTAPELAHHLVDIADNIGAYPETVILAGETHSKCEVLGYLNAALGLGHVVVPEPGPVCNRAMRSKYGMFEVPPLVTMIARMV